MSRVMNTDKLVYNEPRHHRNSKKERVKNHFEVVEICTLVQKTEGTGCNVIYYECSMKIAWQHRNLRFIWNLVPCQYVPYRQLLLART